MWLPPPFASRSTRTHNNSPSTSASGVGKSPVPVQLDTLPQPIIIEILKRCDRVSIARCSRVCSSLRSTVHSDMDRPSPTIEPSLIFGRLFIPDRRRAIIERFAMKNEEKPKRERVVSDGTPASPPGSSAHSAALSKRSHSYCTIRSLSSEHSIKDFLDTVYDKPIPTMKERLQPRSSNFHADQMVDTNEPSWEYNFNMDSWLADYDITEVLLQNFANFLEREGGPIAGAASVIGNVQQAKGPCGEATLMGGPDTPVYSPYQSLDSTRTANQRVVVDELTDHIKDMQSISSGRFERLSSKLAPINPLHLVFRDHSLYARRPVQLIFWFISLLRPNLRRVTLDSLQSNDRIKVDRVLPLNHIEQLNIRQAKINPALIVTEELLFEWLRLPPGDRAKISFRFTNCRRISAKGMCRFIREWQTYPEVAEFDSIIIDEDSMYPWEFVEEAGKDIMRYEQEDYLRPRLTDLPAYLTSKNELLTEEQSESLKKTMEFRHSKGARAVKYYYEDGLLIFTCCTSTLVASPIRSSASSSHLLIGCSPPRASPLTRPGSMPRIHPTELHTHQPPAPNPGMMGRIMRILSSNA